MKCKLLILLILLLLPVIALADMHTVENEKLLLTIDDTTLFMTVTDKATGKSFASSIKPASGKLTGWKAFVASPLALDVVDGQSVITKQQALMGNQTAIDELVVAHIGMVVLTAIVGSINVAEQVIYFILVRYLIDWSLLCNGGRFCAFGGACINRGSVLFLGLCHR